MIFGSVPLGLTISVSMRSSSLLELAQIAQDKLEPLAVAAQIGRRDVLPLLVDIRVILRLQARGGRSGKRPSKGGEGP